MHSVGAEKLLVTCGSLAPRRQVDVRVPRRVLQNLASRLRDTVDGAVRHQQYDLVAWSDLAEDAVELSVERLAVGTEPEDDEFA